MFEVQEFYQEIRRRNKAKFIKAVSEQIAKDNQSGDINIPYFFDAKNYQQEAEDTFNEFQKDGCFDEYGYLKKI